MELLRNLGSAAASSLLQKTGISLPYNLGPLVQEYNVQSSVWRLWDATLKEDNAPVSVFEFEAGRLGAQSIVRAKNALRKLRTIRHPDVLKFIDGTETDTSVKIVTERVRPLAAALSKWSRKPRKAQDEWIIWGLHRISVALAFINESAGSTHGGVHIDSVFISPSGEWRLGGFESVTSPKDDAGMLYAYGSLLPSGYAPPEGWKRDVDPGVGDGYTLGLLLYSVFNPESGLPACASPPHPPPTAKTNGALPSHLFPYYKRLLNPSTKNRMTAKAFLDAGMGTETSDGARFFADNHLVQVCGGLDGFAVASEAEKNALLRSLKESAASFPPEFAANRVLPALISALEFGGASAATILPLLLELGANVPSAEYPTRVLAPLVKLYASPDRGTRMALLDTLPQYAEHLDNKTVTEKIWPNLQTGFTDTVALIRESTVRSIDHLSTKLGDRILNNELLRHLAKMQMDPEASIRTNTCILIGRLAPTLSSNTKHKVLVPAFTRSLKDVFPPCRASGLMALMATIDCFDADEAATKVIPAMSGLLVDKEKSVRDQAFKCLEVYRQRLESHSAQMPETVLMDGQTVNSPALHGQNVIVSSATGAAGALAGWAMSSISRKLMSSELATTMEQRPSSTPPTALTGNSTTNSTGFTPVVSPTPSSTTIPKVTSGTKGKGMVLGATHKPSVVNQVLSAEGGDAWGEDGKDLMDVNADADDWSAFESAQVATDESTNAWADGLDDPSPPPQPQFNLTTTPITKSTPRSSSLAPSSKAPIRSTSPAIKTTPASPPQTVGKSNDSWNDNPWNEESTTLATSRSATPTPAPSAAGAQASLSGLSKEDKAAEMARRREERKQRIAQLKEQKKAAGA